MLACHQLPGIKTLGRPGSQPPPNSPQSESTWDLAMPSLANRSNSPEIILEFGGLTPAVMLAIPKSQQFAEKVHAYTFPWSARLDTRTKELIDLMLLIERRFPGPFYPTASKSRRSRSPQVNAPSAKSSTGVLDPPLTRVSSFELAQVFCVSENQRRLSKHCLPKGLEDGCGS